MALLEANRFMPLLLAALMAFGRLFMAFWVFKEVVWIPFDFLLEGVGAALGLPLYLLADGFNYILWNVPPGGG